LALRGTGVRAAGNEASEEVLQHHHSGACLRETGEEVVLVISLEVLLVLGEDVAAPLGGVHHGLKSHLFVLAAAEGLQDTDLSNTLVTTRTNNIRGRQAIITSLSQT
jgi:ADP-ribose pyrophosphatase YjhB (NUDIX family)